jgi:hypothetical protein
MALLGDTPPTPFIFILKDATAVNPASRAIRILGWLLSGAVASQAVCLPAVAALGGDVTTVAADGARMKAAVRVTSTTASYTVHEFTTLANTVVREYANPNGKVFALTWKGHDMPDLEQILGVYYNDYQNAANAPHRGHRHLSVERSDLVIHSNGRLRDFSGSAYVPALFPANFTLANIE